MRTTFRALVWMDNTGFYFPDGALKIISCNNSIDGVFGINTVGEVIPARSATKTLSETGTDYQHAQVGVRAGHIYISTTEFAGTDFKAVVRVKDLKSNQTYYVDQASFNTNFATCNDCCIPVDCIAPAPAVTVGPGATTATIAWPAVEGSVVYEYKLTATASGACVAPVSGTTLTAAVSVALTGLTAETRYCFCVRNTCAVGRSSDYVCVIFTTTA